jgi:hypothetical protein
MLGGREAGIVGRTSGPNSERPWLDVCCHLDERGTNDNAVLEQYRATKSSLVVETSDLLVHRRHEYISKLPDSYRTDHTATETMDDEFVFVPQMTLFFSILCLENRSTHLSYGSVFCLSDSSSCFVDTIHYSFSSPSFSYVLSGI